MAGGVVANIARMALPTITRFIGRAAVGAAISAAWGAGDEYLNGGSSSDIADAAMSAGIIGAAVGPLISVRFLGPVILAGGIGMGADGVLDAISGDNFALAVYRSVGVLQGARTLARSAPGTFSSLGGRKGGLYVRSLNQNIIKIMTQKGEWKHIAGGDLPESRITNSIINRFKYTDLTFKNVKTGEIIHVNTVDTYANGSPSLREMIAAAFIRKALPANERLILINKDS